MSDHIDKEAAFNRAKAVLSKVFQRPKAPRQVMKEYVADAVQTAGEEGRQQMMAAIEEMGPQVSNSLLGMSEAAKQELIRHGTNLTKQVAPGAAAGMVSGSLAGLKNDDPRGGAARGLVAGGLGGIAGRAAGPGYTQSAIGGALTGAAAGGLFGKKGSQEIPMINKYAGVTLDFYDDLGATLVEHYPTLDELPDVIKTANVRPKEELDQEDFALVAFDDGNMLCKFACHDPGTTVMSTVYFLDHADKLPDSAVKMAAANLTSAWLRYRMTPPEELLKIAKDVSDAALGGGLLGGLAGGVMTRHLAGALAGAGTGALLNASGTALGNVYDKRKNAESEKEAAAEGGVKLAEVIDITGQRPKPLYKVASSNSNDDYAVILPDGSRHYPIHTWDLMKTAENYYAEESIRMQPEIRRQFATKLAAKASEAGYPLLDRIREAGSQTFADDHILQQALEMRKTACAPGVQRELLDSLFEKRAEMGADTYSEVLRRFDVEAGLDNGWDHVFLNPWESTYGISKVANVIWEQGIERVTEDELKNLAMNGMPAMNNIYSHAMIDAFQKDPVGIFKSLPDPQKVILARLANGASTHQSEHQVAAGT